MTDRKILTQISSRAWEHPADRAALNTLRALPGFDEVVKKVAGALGETGLRQLFLANAVRVGPTQRPKLDAIYTDVLATLDWPVRPQLYISQTPFVNAGAIGFEQPFIVLNSGTLALLNEEEQRDILGHELGHIMSGHVVYSTIAIIIMTVGLNNLPFLAGIALMPFQLALLEWYRKAEFSSDRAGLLATQSRETSLMTFLKLAGGGAKEDEQIDLEAFMSQAAEYETQGSAWERVWKILNTAFRDHPFNTVRAAELQRWISSGEYDRILAGEYLRRGDEGTKPLGDDFVDAAGYYGEQTRQFTDQAVTAINKARERFSDAFRNATK
jgi:Zn-dependent protease with chaperone function